MFPAAGLGTRFLPATKAIPKEMLPLVDKPLIQYSVEEAVDSGLDDIIIVTGMGKSAIEDHFDKSFELEYFLKKKNKLDNLKSLEKISQNIYYSYTRQKEPLGLGHAILCAKRLVGDEPFAAFLSDDVIISKTPAMKQMLGIFERHRASVLAVQRVPMNQTHQYGIVKGKKVGPGLFSVEDLVEKPKTNPPSNLAIIGRYILTPEVFGCLETTKRGSGGEIQLTDGIKTLLKKQPVFAFEFEGTRFDAGDKLGFLKATVTLGTGHDNFGKELKKHIKTLKF